MKLFSSPYMLAVISIIYMIGNSIQKSYFPADESPAVTQQVATPQPQPVFMQAVYTPEPRLIPQRPQLRARTASLVLPAEAPAELADRPVPAADTLTKVDPIHPDEPVAYDSEEEMSFSLK